ncbi:MAG: hypothetical protein QOI52_783, partial [Chloroflexota bacterium]|nr:hypothetical protein [Chloroflexota bacterium]
MSGHRRRRAATAAAAVLLPAVLALVGACIPAPADGPGGSPTTSLQPTTVAVATPAPTAVPSG